MSGSTLNDNFRCIVVFRLYNQLEEVKQRKAIEERQQVYAQNREKRKEFEKVLFSYLICVYLSILFTAVHVHYVLFCLMFRGHFYRVSED